MKKQQSNKSLQERLRIILNFHQINGIGVQFGQVTGQVITN